MSGDVVTRALRSAVVIANPRAGVAARAALSAVQSARTWNRLDLRITEHRGHARELATEAARRGEEFVIACGGDGTINEVAWGLLGSEATMGVIPAGSGNGLARTLGIPRHPVRALATLAGCVIRRMDVGMANGKPFLNVAGAGFDAAVGLAFDEHGKKGGRRGLSGYFRVGLRVALGYRGHDVSLAAGDAPWERTALLVAFANGRQYGGGAVIAPRARLDDGQLDVVTVEAAPAFELAWHASRMYIGQVEQVRRYRRVLAAAAVLTGAEPMVFHRDGEPEPPAQRFEIGIQAQALRVLVPRDQAAQEGGPFGHEG
jgi:YegS/Rv2252/BmrU family lipid kinase